MLKLRYTVYLCNFKMFHWIIVTILACLAQGADSTASQEAILDVSFGHFQVLGGVLLIIVLVALIALCIDEPVEHMQPIPPWVYTVQLDPHIDTGFLGSSDGINIIDRNTVRRHRRGHFETDGAKWGAPLSKGKHVFEIYWPLFSRGTLATVGVGTENAPLFAKPRSSLVGGNRHSWGLDIARRRIMNCGTMAGQMPRASTVPDKFFMYVDCDSGTVGFGSDFGYWGAPLIIPKSKMPVYAMIGTMCEGSQITMIYRGTAMNTPGPMGISTVVVPSVMLGGAVQTTYPSNMVAPAQVIY